MVEISIEDDPSKAVKIRSQLVNLLKEQLVDFQKEYSDMFVWTHQEMPQINLKIIVHHLSTKPLTKLIQQKRRSLNAERAVAIKKELDKL